MSSWHSSSMEPWGFKRMSKSFSYHGNRSGPWVQRRTIRASVNLAHGFGNPQAANGGRTEACNL
eukprot:3837995-Amphidinium_carterae.1